MCISGVRLTLYYRDMASSITDHLRTGHKQMGAVEAANKNIKRILRKMIETSRDWSEKLPFTL